MGNRAFYREKWIFGEVSECLSFKTKGSFDYGDPG